MRGFLFGGSLPLTKSNAQGIYFPGFNLLSEDSLSQGVNRDAQFLRSLRLSHPNSGINLNYRRLLLSHFEGKLKLKTALFNIILLTNIT
jgi:hypothetical protein